MAVIVVEENDETKTIQITNQNSVVEINNTDREVVEVGGTSEGPVVIEVLKGLPGVQNLYVGPTPPDNPEEGWVWIDTNG